MPEQKIKPEDLRNWVPDEKGGETIVDVCKRLGKQGQEAIVNEYTTLKQKDIDWPATAFQNNKKRNRWGDILCFDATRVVLKGGNNDYIHANYLNGYRTRHKYIATQGPTTATLEDFWRMVWQENVLIVVALTKLGGGKCELYFPEEVTKVTQYGQFKVENTSVRAINGIYDAVTLQLSRGGQSRRVLQFTYYMWPDKGSPQDAGQILRFIDQINHNQEGMVKEGGGDNGPKGTKHPIVIHCSAGVGRTGTLVALDVACRRLEHTFTLGRPSVDVFTSVLALRAQRAKMVQKVDQYCFLYMAIIEYALSKNYVDANDVDMSPFLNCDKEANDN